MIYQILTLLQEKSWKAASYMIDEGNLKKYIKLFHRHNLSHCALQTVDKTQN